MIHLIVQYFNSKNKDRVKEYNYCLRKNLNNPAIKMIHNLIEKDTKIPPEFNTYTNMKIVRNEERLTFKRCFVYARKNIPHNEIVCIINSDIFLDYSDAWNNLKPIFFTKYYNKVLCLSRHEYINDSLKFFDNVLQEKGGSCDCWCYLNPIKILESNYKLGSFCCDGTINRRFYNAGYTPLNHCKKYKIYHYDVCRGRVVYCQDRKLYYRQGHPIDDEKDKGYRKNEDDLETLLKYYVKGWIKIKPHQNWDIIENDKSTLELEIGKGGWWNPAFKKF